MSECTHYAVFSWSRTHELSSCKGPAYKAEVERDASRICAACDYVVMTKELTQELHERWIGHSSKRCPRTSRSPMDSSCIDRLIADLVELDDCDKVDLAEAAKMHAQKREGKVQAVLSRGIGDSLSKTLHRLHVKKKKNCRCGSRQRWMNKLVPYSRPVAAMLNRARL